MALTAAAVVRNKQARALELVREAHSYNRSVAGLARPATRGKPDSWCIGAWT